MIENLHINRTSMPLRQKTDNGVNAQVRRGTRNVQRNQEEPMRNSQR